MERLIGRQLEVLYSRDRSGRLLATRDADPRPAPRLHLGRSAEGNVWAVRGDVAPDVVEAIERACAGEAPLALASADRPPACRERVFELLAPVANEWRGPAFLLRDELPEDRRARRLRSEELPLCRDAFPWLATAFPAIEPVVVGFENGIAASVCHSPRGCTRWAAEAGVETLPEFRDRGLATAAVACWARLVRRAGRLALYSTSWENTASQAVARHLSARLYGEDWHLG